MMLIFDTVVDNDRTERVEEIDSEQDGVRRFRAQRNGGPLFRLHDGGDVDLEARNADVVLGQFGENGRVEG